MKIGYDAKRAFLNTSGLGNYSRNTLNGLQTFFPEHEYTLYTTDIKPGMLEEQERFRIIAPPKDMSGFHKSIWRSSRISKEMPGHGIDLFHGLSNELPRGIRASGIPSLVTVHDLIFIRYPEFYKYFDRMIYWNKMRYTCRAATRILAISEQTKADIVKYMGTDPAKITVLHQAISPVFFGHENAASIKTKYGLPERFILAVGTIEERKNQLSILKAMQAQNIDLPLVLVGEPTSYANDIHKYLEQENIRERVIFLKNIPETDLAGIYRLAELSVYISVFEGFGLPVIEAMASGCPVITSKASCLPETAGDAAILCDPGNIDELGTGIQKVLADKKFRDELIAKGKKRAEEFKAAEHAKKLLALYREIVAQKA